MMFKNPKFLIHSMFKNAVLSDINPSYHSNPANVYALYDHLTSLKNASKSQVSNFRVEKISFCVVLYQSCISTKLFSVMLPSGKSNAFVRVRIFLQMIKENRHFFPVL